MKNPARVLCVVLFSIVFLPSLVRAATFTVNSTLDAVDATPGDGICATAGAVCTLRAAIQEANALAGSDTIIVPAGTYTLTIAGTNEQAAATGDLDITSTITIQGDGADVTTVDAAGLDRTFEVTAAGNATLRGLRITGGNPGGNGGGILASGTTLIDRCAVVGNTGSFGGGILSNGAAITTITDTTISGNTGTGQGGGANLQGTGGQALTNVTISSNGAAVGGGLIVFNGGTLTNVTFAANTETGASARSLAVGSGTLTLKNTLVTATQAGVNCLIFGALSDGGGNLAGNAACGAIPANAALTGSLGALTVNAPGKTATHALLPGSPAIGAGISCPAADQRGVTRGAVCDSGAYQLSSGGTSTPTPAPAVLPTISGIANQTLQQNTPVSIPFTISGAIIANALRTSATTSNPTLFPSLTSSISCDQGGRCVLQLAPADGRAGSAVITISVSDGTNATSESFTATVSAVRPSPTTGIAAVSIGSGLTLTWTPPDTGAPLAYVLSWGTTAGGSNLPVQLIDGNATRFDILALPSGPYYLRFAAVGTGDIGPSTEVPAFVSTDAAVPGPPMGIEANAVGGLEATWQLPVIGAQPTLFEEQIGTAIGKDDVASPTDTSFHHDERVPPGAYWVRVRAVTGGAAGPWSSSVQIPIGLAVCTSAPTPPILLPVSVTPGAAAFTWIPGQGTAERYEVEVAPGAGLAPTIALNSAGAGTSLTWLAPRGTWAGRVIARNACGTSAPSNEIRFVQP